MLRRVAAQLACGGGPLAQQWQQQPVPGLLVLLQAQAAPVAALPPLLRQQQQPFSSQRLSPQQQKKQQKREKKGGAGPSAAAAGGGGTADAAGSFADEAAAVEGDVTRLVLQAIANVTPLLDVRPIRTATKVNYVPGLMPAKRARSLALHWLVKAADARAKNAKGRYAECLALELLLAYQKQGAARAKRDELHKLALQNRANVHLRWW